MTNQEDRKKRYNETYLPVILQEIEKGILRPNDLDQVGARSWVWNCLTLFETGYEQEANDIILQVELYACEFLPMQFCSILKRYRSLLRSDSVERMKQYILGSLDHAAQGRIHVSMYNDNFAHMAAFTLLAAGELFDLPQYFAIGLEKLRDTTDMFRRCGQIMEYSSPVYTAVDTLVFAEMYNLIDDPVVRKMALKCEERMWIEVASLFHAPSGRMAGPISRAYTADTLGHPNITTSLLWMGFGDAVYINPLADYFPPRENQFIHISENALLLPNCGWICNVPYHIPDYLLELALHKQFPFEAAFTTECIPSNALAYLEADDEYTTYGGYRGFNYTYMEEEYAMGTAKGQYHSGAMSDSFYITYKNIAAPKNITHSNVVFAKYIFNDKEMEKANTYQYYGEAHPSGFRDEGRKFGIQHKNTSLVAYKPSNLERENVFSAKLSIYFPCHFFDKYLFYSEEKVITQLPYESVEPTSITVDIGLSFLHFRPLCLTDLSRKAAVKIYRENKYIILSFYNYEGEATSFDSLTLLLAQNGFVCTCQAKKKGSLSQFLASVSAAQVLDTLEESAKEITRRVRYSNQDTELFLTVHPISESIVADTVNKRPRGAHIPLLKVDTLDLSKVPFTEENEI